MFQAEDEQTLRSVIKKRAKYSELEELLLLALDGGAEGQLTASGIILRGPSGETVGTHWSNGTDAMGLVNMTTRMRRAGINIPRKRSKHGKVTKKRGQAHTGPIRLVPPRPHEPQREPQAVTVVVQERVEYVDQTAPVQRRSPGARATDTVERSVPAWFAPTYARLPERLRHLPPELVMTVLENASGDHRRITVEEDGTVMVWNTPRA